MPQTLKPDTLGLNPGPLNSEPHPRQESCLHLKDGETAAEREARLAHNLYMRFVRSLNSSWTSN